MVGGVQVRRWRRYGKDRLYVSGPCGDGVGWFDLQTGQRHCERTELAEAFDAAIQDYLAAGVTAVEPAPPAAASDSPPAAAAPDRCASNGVIPLPADSYPADGPTPAAASEWVDLAENRPGQAARAQAVAELAAMKDASRVRTVLARVFDAKTEERAWRIGADGEKVVGARLDRLAGRGWHVLHAVPVGERGSDIDHVVIGPGGVYTVNTKNHPGASVWVGKRGVRVNGHRAPYLRNSRHEAARASRLLTAAAGLDVQVRPVLVFLTGRLIPNVTIKQMLDDVLVLDRTDIPGAFKRTPRLLADQAVTAVYAAARRSTTWQPAPTFFTDRTPEA